MQTKFHTGDKIPENGIYYVYHPEHRLVRSVTLLGGDQFPRCSQCADQVVFEMMVPLTHVYDYEPLHVFELPVFSDDEDVEYPPTQP